MTTYKRINTVLTFLFVSAWLTIFILSALWLSDGKYLTFSYSFIGISLTLSGAGYCIGLINKNL